MKSRILFKNICVVNESKKIISDVLIEDKLIADIGQLTPEEGDVVIDGTNKFLLPGVIDGQVHFREPGLTHKGTIYSESRAAIAGGVTSYIDMPNTVPNVLTMEILEEKNAIASTQSFGNYSFFLGVNAENIDYVLQTDTSSLLGVSDDGLYFTKKGNLLADNPEIMEKLFSNCKSLVAIHAEKEEIIEFNEKTHFDKYGENVPIKCHPIIRSERACLEATERAIDIAKKHNTRLHILHLTTEAETVLFDNDKSLNEKRITTEVSVQNLWFSDKDYERLGTRIKWNPAIKSESDKIGLLSALLDNRIDIITTDHAPHSLNEKNQTYFKAMSGAPMIQHSLNIMLELHNQGKIPIEIVVEKMCHNPARLYNISQRGFIRKGYYADLVIVDLDSPWTVSAENIMYKCGWSPLEGTTFSASVTHTFVNGRLCFKEGVICDLPFGMPLQKE